MILKFNYKTPGREDEGEAVELKGKKVDDETMAVIVEGLGGSDNILNVDACFTRLRVKVKDKSLVMSDEDWKKKTGANGVVRVNDGVQIVYGTKADIYKNNLKTFWAWTKSKRSFCPAGETGKTEKTCRSLCFGVFFWLPVRQIPALQSSPHGGRGEMRNPSADDCRQYGMCCYIKQRNVIK